VASAEQTNARRATFFCFEQTRAQRDLLVSTQSLELRRSRAKLIDEMADLTEKTTWTAEAQKRWRDLDLQQKDLEKRVIKAETESLTDEMRQVIAPPQPQVGSGYPGFERRTVQQPQQENFSESRQLRPFASQLGSPEYKEAFNRFMRGGSENLNSEQRTMLSDVSHEIRTYTGLNTSTSGDAAGYAIPISFQKELEIKLKAYGRMRNICRILNTDAGNTLDWPTFDDTGNEGEFLAEANPVTQQNPTFGQIQFQSFLASSKQVLLSLQLVQDNAVNLESVLADEFGKRIGRRVNRAYTNGTGTGEPQGLLYAIKNDAVPNVVKATGSSTNDGVTGNTEANSIGSDDLDNLISAVDPSYREGSIFMMHSNTIDALRRTKDKYGRMLWQASLALGTPDRIFGYPFEYNQDFDAIGAGKYPVCFGNFSKHVIRDAGGLTMAVYRELYLPNHQLGYQSWLRTDSRRIQAAAFSLLYNPLS
jgi:HK97 family phage major capsid protein